jgi:TRAP-type uncharacterized transport system fused permease subunit
LQTLPAAEDVAQIAGCHCFSIVAVFFLNVIVIGYLKDNLTRLERYIAGAGAVMLFYPLSATDVIGCTLNAAFMIKKWIETRKDKPAPSQSTV